MNINLNQEQIKQIREEYLVIDGEKLGVFEESSEMDDNGKYITRIFHRKSDNKYFETSIFLTRYGYEDYGFDLDMQEYTAYEVQKKPVTTYVWEYIK